jgi:hypothetical protein
MNVASWVQRAAFIGATGLIAAALWPAGGAHATAPPQVFTSMATAEGVTYDFDRNPQISQVAGATAGAAPHATSTLAAGSGGIAQAASVYLGGLEGVPDLICTAAADSNGNSFCSSIPAPKPGDFPPPFPFEANAQYPSNPTADATVHGSTIGGKGAPLAVTPQTAHAVAHLLDASATAVSSSSTFGNGVVSTGAGSTVTTQAINAAGAVVTTAETIVHNVSIVNLVKIGTVHTIIKVVYDGVKKPTVTASTTVSGASVLGLPAAIDQSGIHIVGQTNKTVLAQLNEQLAFLLQGDYTTMSLVGVSKTPGDHKVQVQGGGLLVSYTDNVSGVPRPPPSQDIPHCEDFIKKRVPKPIQDGLSQLPANLCSPPQPPDPNADYFGVANIGSAGVLVMAQNYNYNFGGVGGGLLPGGGPIGGPGSQFVPGTAAVPGTSGTPGLTGSPGEAPQLAGPDQSTGSRAAAYVEDLSGVAGKLKYLFPALLLAVIGILAGRVVRAPARLPGAGT